MPRVLVDLCNPCFKEGNEEPGTMHVVRYGVKKSDKPRMPIYCERHFKQLLEPLLLDLADAEVWDEADAALKPGPLPAAAPSSGGSSSGPSTTPSPHAPEGFMAKKVLEKDLPKDLPAPVTEGDLQTWSCPEKECKGNPETAWTNRERRRPQQSLRIHLRTAHNWDV